MSTQSKITHSTHVAPSTMSLFLSPLAGSRWRMVFQISSSESISLSLVLSPAFVPYLPPYYLPTSAPSMLQLRRPGSRFMIPKAAVCVICAICASLHIIDFRFQRESSPLFSCSCGFSRSADPQSVHTVTPLSGTVTPRVPRLVEFVGASGVGENGNLVSTTGLSFPASTEFCDFRQLYQNWGAHA